MAPISTTRRSGPSAGLPQDGAGLAPARRHVGLVLVVVGLPLLTVLLVALRGSLALASMLLLYLLAVVVIAVVGGVVPAVLGAIASFLLANWFLTPPFMTLKVADRDSVVELLVFLLVALAVSITVDLAARRQVAATRSTIEARLLARFTEEPVTEVSHESVLERVRLLFFLDRVAVLEASGGADRVVAAVGPTTDAQPAFRVPAGPGLQLFGWGGRATEPLDDRLLGVLAQAAGRVVEGQRLADEAARARELAAVDRLRSALLAAVGHELRTPLAGVKVAVSTLRQRDITWSADQTDQLLATIEESSDRLAEVLANVLDLSRLQAGALSVRLLPVALDEVVDNALTDPRHRDLRDAVPDQLPLVLADPGLLERVVVNLVDNAQRFSPSQVPATISAELIGPEHVELRVVDHGPGVPEGDWDRLFVPFQRLHDHSATTGLGLGLAIARGFIEAMDGTLVPSHTIGGGLTMSVTLPVAR